MTRQRMLALGVRLSAVRLVAACGGNGGGTAPPPPPPPPAPVVIEKATPSGDGQTVIGGQAITSPLRVTVTRSGAAAPGQAVTWSASSGTITGNGTSSSDGIATASWVLGAIAGTQTATATAAASSTQFTATALALPPGSATVKLFTSGGSRFEPAILMVAAGTTVSFVWQDGFHDLLPTGSPTFPGVANVFDPPKTYQFTFTTAGTYRYFCSVHGSPTSGMRGTVIVQ